MTDLSIAREIITQGSYHFTRNVFKKGWHRSTQAWKKHIKTRLSKVENLENLTAQVQYNAKRLDEHI